MAKLFLHFPLICLFSLALKKEKKAKKRFMICLFLLFSCFYLLFHHVNIINSENCVYVSEIILYCHFPFFSFSLSFLPWKVWVLRFLSIFLAVYLSCQMISSFLISRSFHVRTVYVWKIEGEREISELWLRFLGFQLPHLNFNRNQDLFFLGFLDSCMEFSCTDYSSPSC